MSTAIIPTTTFSRCRAARSHSSGSCYIWSTCLCRRRGKSHHHARLSSAKSSPDHSLPSASINRSTSRTTLREEDAEEEDDELDDDEDEKHRLSKWTDPGGRAVEDDDEVLVAEDTDSVQSRRKLSGSCIQDSWYRVTRSLTSLTTKTLCAVQYRLLICYTSSKIKQLPRDPRVYQPTARFAYLHHRAFLSSKIL